MDNWKSRIYLVSGLIGVAVGLLAGYIIISRSEELHATPQLTAGDGVKVGLGVIGLLRLVSEFSEPKES